MKPFRFESGVRAALCAVPALCLALACACSSLEPPPEDEDEMPDLTTEQIANMSSDEVQAYYAKKNAESMRKKRQTRQERSEKWYYKLNSVEKRERLGDMNRSLPDDADNAVYPWRSSSTRSDELNRSKKSVIYDW